MYTIGQDIRIPMSQLGAMDADLHFSLPHHAAKKFPFGKVSGSPDLAGSHFLCQCSRLVYEDVAIIQDVVTSR